MKPVLFYLLQVIIASGLLYSYYHFALRNNRFHRYNRFYLLMSALISAFIPFLNIPIYFSQEQGDSSVVFQTLQVISAPSDEIIISNTADPSVHNSNVIGLDTILYFIYFLIALILVIRIFFSINKIRQIIRKYPHEQFDRINFVNTNEPGTPFSFFKWMFWNRKIELNSEKGEQIFRHELFHIQQKHSWDIIFMEVISTIFWINPFFHLIKKEIKAIHEFLADEFAIKENRNWEYAELLLMQALNTNTQLVNPFFHNQIKRRIAMITLSKNPSYQYLRKIMVLPIAVVITALFAFSYKNKSNITDNEFKTAITNQFAETRPYFKNLSDTSKLSNALVVINGVIQEKRGIQNIDTNQFGSKAFNGTVNIFWDKEAINKYGDKGKDGVIELNIDTIPKVDTVYKVVTLGTPAKKIPTAADLKSWQDSKMYGVWIDDKRINNDLLAKYKPSDFDLYYVSKLEKNAVNYGKHYYQVDLYSHSHYESVLKKTSDRSILVRNIVQQDSAKASFPLIVLNGKAMAGLSMKELDNTITPNHIKIINVLKGKSATDKYGKEAKDGAIEINTEYEKDGVKIKEVVLEKPQAVKEGNVDNKIFSKVEIEAAFPGGFNGWRNFLTSNLDPTIPLDSGAKAGKYTVVLQFIVNRDGSISDIKALTSQGFGMEEECIRLMNLSPKWIPAMQNGRAVKAYRKQPITFVISEDTNDESKAENPKSILTETKQLATIYPNPATDKATIVFNSNMIQKGEVRVYDAMANLVLVNPTNFVKGQNIVTINVSSLSQGTYVIQVVNADKKVSKGFKLIKK